MRSFRGFHYFLPCDLDLGVWPILKKINLAYNIWTVSARALIFPISIPCDETFPWVPLFFTLWPWLWSLTNFLKTLNFKLAISFWKMSARALIFHMSIPCDKTFPWVPLFFTLWPWLWSLTYFLKTLTLLITFEKWVLEISYCTWAFLLTRSSYWIKIFFLVTLAIFGIGHYWGHLCFTNTSVYNGARWTVWLIQQFELHRFPLSFQPYQSIRKLYYA